MAIVLIFAVLILAQILQVLFVPMKGERSDD